jgi:membrane protein required for colicin V production
LKIIALGWLNRISGALFGFLKWGVLLSALVLISQEINEIITLMPEATINKSKSYPILMELGNFLFDWVMQTQTVQEQQFI